MERAKLASHDPLRSVSTCTFLFAICSCVSVLIVQMVMDQRVQLSGSVHYTDARSSACLKDLPRLRAVAAGTVEMRVEVMFGIEWETQWKTVRNCQLSVMRSGSQLKLLTIQANERRMLRANERRSERAAS